MSVRPKLTTVPTLKSAVTLSDPLSVSARKDILDVLEVCIIILIKN